MDVVALPAVVHAEGSALSLLGGVRECPRPASKRAGHFRRTYAEIFRADFRILPRFAIIRPLQLARHPIYPSVRTEESTLKLRPVVILFAVLTFVGTIVPEASAGRRARAERPANTTTILPSREEIAAVPTPEQGHMVAYPVDVVRYGLTVHPGARMARRVLGR